MKLLIATDMFAELFLSNGCLCSSGVGESIGLLPHIYTMVHSVGPSVVIAFLSKNVPVLGEKV
jgi:hypothetical protein